MNHVHEFSLADGLTERVQITMTRILLARGQGLDIHGALWNENVQEMIFLVYKMQHKDGFASGFSWIVIRKLSVNVLHLHKA